MGVKRKPTIEQLEKLLTEEEDTPIEILPNGQIKRGKKGKRQKVLTMRENLGGEYGR